MEDSKLFEYHPVENIVVGWDGAGLVGKALAVAWSYFLSLAKHKSRETSNALGIAESFVRIFTASFLAGPALLLSWGNIVDINRLVSQTS